MSRPFAAGDILIIETPSMVIDNPPPPEKYTAECTKVFNDGFIAVTYKSYINRHDITIIFNADGESIDGHDVIKVIRAQRKGCKEARDIVAMLGKQARIAKNLQARELGWKFLKEFYRNGGIKNYGVVIFESAKSMLGGRNA